MECGRKPEDRGKVGEQGTISRGLELSGDGVGIKEKVGHYKGAGSD